MAFHVWQVGSESNSGAGSTVVTEALSRVSACFAPDEPQGSAEALAVSIRHSFLVSADTAHAIHPNWAEKHQSAHTPKLNEGTVIKTNDNQRYATNTETGFVIRELARQAGVGIQEFMVKNDCPCGSTIGPMISAKTGLRTVDVGVPLLSMHSIRETMGTADIESSLKLKKAFFRSFTDLDAKCNFVCPMADCGGASALLSRRDF